MTKKWRRGDKELELNKGCVTVDTGRLTDCYMQMIELPVPTICDNLGPLTISNSDIDY